MTGMCRYISETVQTRSSALWRAGACRKRAPGDHEFTCVRCPRSGLRATTLAASPAGDIDLVDAEHRSGNPDRPGLARPSDPWSIEEAHEPLGLVPSAPAEQARPAAPDLRADRRRWRTAIAPTTRISSSSSYAGVGAPVFPHPELHASGRFGHQRAVASILGAHPFESNRLISVPVCIGPPSTVALRIGPETYETAALPLSYVGA